MKILLCDNRPDTRARWRGGILAREPDIFEMSSVENLLQLLERDGDCLLFCHEKFINSVEAQNAGVDVVRIWDATLDDRTRPSHADLDGKPEDKNGLWHAEGASADYPGGFGVAELDINCRCIAIETIGGVPPEARRGRDPVTGETDIMSYERFPEWARENDLSVNRYGQSYGTVMDFT